MNSELLTTIPGLGQDKSVRLSVFVDAGIIEAAGASAEVAAAASGKATIVTPGGAESLNVAASAAICFYERERQRITLTGDRKIAATMQSWLGLSPFAAEPKRVKA